MRVESGARPVPGGVDDLGAVGLRRRVRGGQGEEEPGVEARLHELRRDPSREEDQIGAALQADPGLLLQLAHGAGPHSRLALAVARIDRATGKDPGAGHEGGLVASLEEEHLERPLAVLGAAAQEDHRAGGSRGRGLAFVEGFRRPRGWFAHRLTLHPSAITAAPAPVPTRRSSILRRHGSRRKAAVDLHLVRVHLRPRGGRPRRGRAPRHGIRGQCPTTGSVRSAAPARPTSSPTPTSG